MFDEKLARRRYHRHKGVAKQRNVPFELSYDEWINTWLQSGKYDLMGCGTGKYCMSRYNDIGPYAVNNVFIQLHSNNCRDANKGRKKTKQHIDRWRESFLKTKKENKPTY
jgi:hypothetical protein